MPLDISGAALGLGKILQVTQSLKDDVFTTSSTSMVDIPGLSLSIIPSSTSSKIIVFCSLYTSNTLDEFNYFNIVRDSTPIGVGTGGTNNVTMAAITSSYGSYLVNASSLILDNPNTTSSTTYKVQMKVNASGTGYINTRAANALVRTSSTITAIEVAP